MIIEVTPNLGLKKPAREDFYNVDDFNDNADILDATLKEHEIKIEAAAYITDENGVKYRWGIDGIGVYLEEIEEGGVGNE